MLLPKQVLQLFVLWHVLRQELLLRLYVLKEFCFYQEQLVPLTFKLELNASCAFVVQNLTTFYVLH